MLVSAKRVKDRNTVEVPSNPLIDPDTPANTQPLGLTGWALAMSEEFNQSLTVTDATNGLVTFRPGGPSWATWYPNWARFTAQSPGGNHTNTDEGVYYQTDQVSLSGSGTLLLAAVQAATNGLPYKGGMIQSLPSFTPMFGAFEVRCRASANPTGFWPAAWMSNSVTNQWPPEIDFFEMFGGDTIMQNVYMPSGVQFTTTPASASTATAWHVYSTVWTASSVKFYIDGALTNQTSSVVPNTTQYLLLNAGSRTPASPSFSSANFEVDYIRAWS